METEVNQVKKPGFFGVLSWDSLCPYPEREEKEKKGKKK